MSINTATSLQAYSDAARTVSPTKLVIMMYDGAIRFLTQASVAIAENRIEDRYNLLKKTADIMVGLNSCLDFEQGGEVAHTLHRFYTNMCIRIHRINIDKNAKESLATLIEEVKEMRDAWIEVEKQHMNGTVDASTPSEYLHSSEKLSQQVVISA